MKEIWYWIIGFVLVFAFDLTTVLYLPANIAFALAGRFVILYTFVWLFRYGTKSKPKGEKNENERI